jgi:hypothetical protein
VACANQSAQEILPVAAVETPQFWRKHKLNDCTNQPRLESLPIAVGTPIATPIEEHGLEARNLVVPMDGSDE